MIVSLARLDCDGIHNWDSFHDAFQDLFGFPEFYGRNMDAWIDCMSSLDDPGEGMTAIHCEKGKVVTIELIVVGAFKRRCIDQYQAIVECSAFVNWRLIQANRQPVLALAFEWAHNMRFKSFASLIRTKHSVLGRLTELGPPDAIT